MHYFDLHVPALRVASESLVIRIGEKLDLGFELQVTDPTTSHNRDYRVAWMSAAQDEGTSVVGLELVDAEQQTGKPRPVPADLEEPATPLVLLQCQQCSQTVSVAVPGVDAEFLIPGFIIARDCDTCNARTGWVYCVAPPPEAESPAPEQAPSQAEAAATEPVVNSSALSTERREKGRVPLNLAIKVIRTGAGAPTYDVTETLNVSRTGICFTSRQDYEPGEKINVVFPYHPEGLEIALPATVMRQDARPGTAQKAVAIFIGALSQSQAA
jgi:hypothetical protein